MNFFRQKFFFLVALFVAGHYSWAGMENDSSTVRVGWNGEWRSYLMATANQSELQNWHALASGGRIGGKLNLPKGFSAGLQLYSTVRVVGNDNTSKDSTTGAVSRYESTLFDVKNPSRDVTVFVGELYLDYHNDKTTVRLGRQLLDSPLLNPQDGRVIPSLFEAVWIGRKEKKIDIGVGFIWAMAPRGTGGFYSIEESFGVLSQGRSVLDTPGSHNGNIQSNGIALVKIDYRPLRDFRLLAWNYFTENVFNTLYLESEKSFAISNGLSLSVSGQYIWQKRLNNGGNDSLSLAYFDQDHSHTFGLKSDVHINSNWVLTIAGNLTTDQGRLLFPREWGRESLYTFLRRERSEGNGANQALAFIFTRKIAGWELKASWGRFWHASPEDPVLNKYRVPSYDHLDWSAKYHFKGMLNRMSAEAIFMYKYTFESQTYPPQYLINRANMVNVNLIVNYRLGG